MIVKLDYKILLKILLCPATKLDSFVQKLRDLYLLDTDFCARVSFLKIGLNLFDN